MSNRAFGVAAVLLAIVLGAGLYQNETARSKKPPTKPAPSQPMKPANIKLYFFTAEWCGPCRQLHREMKDAKVQKSLQRFEVIETQDQALLKEYKVTGYPTLVAIGTSGPVKQVGLLSADKLASWLDSIQ